MKQHACLAVVTWLTLCCYLLAQQTAPTTVEACEQECALLLNNLESAPGVGEDPSRDLIAKKATLLSWSDSYPDSPIVRYTTGMAYLVEEDIQSSLEHLRAAYVDSRFNGTIGSTYSLALKMAMQVDESLKVAGQLVEANPDSLKLRYSYALQLKMMQEYGPAIAELNQVLDAASGLENQATIRGNIGECHLYLGEYETAIKLLKQSHEDNPNGRSLAILAEAYVKTNRLGEAKDAIRELLKMSSTHAPSLYLSGVILEAEGRGQRAKKYFMKSYRAAENSLVEDSGVENFLLYKICKKIGEEEKAAKYKEQAERLHFTFEVPWKK